MERYQVIMTAQAPLCFNERRPAEQFRASTGYVPGTVLRGAVASRMVEDGQADTAAFQRLFVHEHPAIFSNGYVAPSVLPATAMSCKAEKGFRRDGKHGVRDTLVERLCVEAFMLAGLLYMPSCSQARGSQDECRSRLERYEGFYPVSYTHLTLPTIYSV